MPTANTIPEAALLLDKKFPTWYKKIDIDNLHMSCSEGKLCILAQLYGEYERGLTILGFSFGGQGHNAFMAGASTDGWIQQIKERLAVGTFKWAVGQTHEGRKVRRKSWERGRTLNRTLTIYELATEDICATNWELISDKITLGDLQRGEQFHFIEFGEPLKTVYSKVWINEVSSYDYYMDKDFVVYRGTHQSEVKRAS